MSGIVENGQLVTVEPAKDREIKAGDVVLCRVNGNQYLHLVKSLTQDRVLIGNNRGYNNGWTPRSKIYGVLTKVEP